MSKVIELSKNLIDEIAGKLGYELVELEFAKKVDGMNLTVVIDKEGGITIDDCEIVHKAIDGPLDQLDPTEGKPYILNVSSPGLDRPIKTERDFERNKGKPVEVTLYVAINKKKKFEGSLLEYNEKTITLELNEKQKTSLVEIEREKIASLFPHITF